MNVNEFDISFCYANEQYATILTGQSIVCLYFRTKPKGVNVRVSVNTFNNKH